MKLKSAFFIWGLALFFVTQCIAQTTEEEAKAIEELIHVSYIGAACNTIDIDILKKGFHDSFTRQNEHHGMLFTTTLCQWIILLEREKWLRPDWNDRTSAEIQVIGIEGNAAQEAGFEILRIETFLPKDYIFILHVKNTP